MSILNGTKRELIVLGGGPAGMAAALFAAEAGAQVTLLERNEKLGKKLYITGKGRCNLTNMAEGEEILENIPRNPRFMRAALQGFDALALRALMERLGVPTKVERGNRVFPVSEKASDVTRALERALERAGVRKVFGARGAEIETLDSRVTGLRLADGTRLPCAALILATGGASYPATGSTGDGYALAQGLGHTVHPPKAGLAPLISPAQWVRGLQGLSLRNVILTGRAKGKTFYQDLGEMLFTHLGISGPLVLTLSSYLPDGEVEGVSVSLDLKPGLNMEQLEQRLLRDFEAQARKQLSNILPGLMPSRLAEVFPALVEISGDKPAHQITRAERLRLVQRIKALEIPVSGVAGLEEAIITRGGVEVREVVPGTMASKRVQGVFFAGELLDVDALTGGFNLQIAFSTGVCAGKAAALWLQGGAQA